jgi:hypothetical protein
MRVLRRQKCQRYPKLHLKWQKPLSPSLNQNLNQRRLRSRRPLLRSKMS